MSGAGPIVVPRFHYDVLRLLAFHDGLEREACALVIALKGIVVGVIAVRNVSEEPWSSFELGLEAIGLWALLSQPLQGFEVLLWHSHVQGPAVASSGDTRWAEPATRQLIYSVAYDELRAFRFERGGEGDRQRLRAVEIPVELAG